MSQQEIQIKRTGGGYRVPIVDYIKAICIVFIIFNHTRVFDGSKPFAILMVYMAVPVFMILSGYVMGLNSGKSSMMQMYEGKRMIRKLIRYLVPMLITYILYEALWTIGQSIISKKIKFGWEYLTHFIFFEYGLGSYYFALMLELLFIAPIMLWIIKRYGMHGVMLLGFLNFFYELCSTSYRIDIKIYRILIFRYLLAISLGMYLGLQRDREIKNEYLIVSFTVGLIYILLPSYFNYQYRFFAEAAWASTSLVSVIYVFPIIYLILHYGYEYKSTSKVGTLLELIGRASYHIMCTQMIYFSVRPYFNQYIFDISKFGNSIILLFDTVVSLLTGMTFYYIDNRFLTGQLIRLIARSQNKRVGGC